MWHQTMPPYQRYPHHGTQAPDVCPSHGRCAPHDLASYYYAHGLCPGCLGYVHSPPLSYTPPSRHNTQYPYRHYNYSPYPPPASTSHDPHYHAWQQGYRDGYYARYGYSTSRPGPHEHQHQPEPPSHGNYPYPLMEVYAPQSTAGVSQAYPPHAHYPQDPPAVSSEADSAYRRFVTRDSPPPEPAPPPSPPPALPNSPPLLTPLPSRGNTPPGNDWHSEGSTTALTPVEDREWDYPSAASNYDYPLYQPDTGAAAAAAATLSRPTSGPTSEGRSVRNSGSLESILRRTRLDDNDNNAYNDIYNGNYDDAEVGDYYFLSDDEDDDDPMVVFTNAGELLLVGDKWQVPSQEAAFREAAESSSTNRSEVRSVHESIDERGEPTLIDVIEKDCEGEVSMSGGLSGGLL
ncbi:hypothetical protein GGS23DRAFT_572864 [Durotheca rogersii]|uniref:uncharacterized protein n=1 Tax=Durotheca rogersii TaxID=419775 RepID=UPI00222088BE|nr:uncharacterized protein GGS23DRAFT_572864 [Durotheca rogersii]KAI5862142.1 hypothetical protein GGS23DRAFT_572864 [Durotheca rogersii]